MNLTRSEFISLFPEFSSITVYTQAQIDIYSELAQLSTSVKRFSGKNYDFARGLFIAHKISLAAKAAGDTATGNLSGREVGAIQSKSIGTTSVNFSTGAEAVGAGEYNLTTYGQMLYRLGRVFGAGALVV